MFAIAEFALSRGFLKLTLHEPGPDLGMGHRGHGPGASTN